MAVANLLTAYENNAKRSGCVAVGTINPAEITTQHGIAANGTLAIGDVVQLAKLPENIVITDAYFVCKVASAQDTAQFEVKAGGRSLVAATAVGNQADKVLGTLADKQYFASSPSLEVEVSVATISSGEFDVVVHYVQLDKINGEYTRTK